MRPSQRFAILRARAGHRLDRLRSQAVAACLQDTPYCRTQIAFVTIELQNLWSNFSRSYYLSCILRPEREHGGKVAVTQFAGNDFNDAITVTMRKHKPWVQPNAAGIWNRRDEPAWHDTSVLIASCQELGCSNLGNIYAALSLGSRVFQDLPIFRNFFGHRNEATAKSARSVANSYSIPSARRHPTQILASSPYGRATPLLVDWIDDVIITVELLCD